jgi:hypothetical protein
MEGLQKVDSPDIMISNERFWKDETGRKFSRHVSASWTPRVKAPTIGIAAPLQGTRMLKARWAEFQVKQFSFTFLCPNLLSIQEFNATRSLTGTSPLLEDYCTSSHS